MRAGSLQRGQLVAHTRRIEARDILASSTSWDFAWWHRDRGLVCNGVARTVAPRDVREVLRSIDNDDGGDGAASGHGPVAVGALPFDSAAIGDAELIIPARVRWRDTDGTTWETTVSEGVDAYAEGGGGAEGAANGRASSPAVGRDTTEAQWARGVDAALAHIAAGRLEKVVLSRQTTVERDGELSVGDVVRRLRANQPGCYIFGVGDFVGASPELLVERRGRSARSRPMAGTVAGGDVRTMAWLARSDKNGREHALVVDAVVRCLEPLCTGPLDVSPPHAEAFADLSHIVTDVVGTLPEDPPTALEIAMRLHPTPAVAGTPTAAALGLIGELEPQSRGYYGGPVGWVDANGDGQFAVALRCGELHPGRAVLYAGAGIVAGSRPDDEWLEAETKFKAMRRAIARH